MRSSKIGELPTLIERATDALLGSKRESPVPPLLIPGAVTAAVGVTTAVIGLSLAGVANENLKKVEVDAAAKEDEQLFGQIFFWTGVGGVVIAAVGVSIGVMGAME